MIPLCGLPGIDEPMRDPGIYHEVICDQELFLIGSGGVTGDSTKP